MYTRYTCYAHRTNTPDLSTVAICCPLVPPFPHAKPTTPALCALLSRFLSSQLATSKTNKSPVSPPPHATYFPSGSGLYEHRALFDMIRSARFENVFTTQEELAVVLLLLLQFRPSIIFNVESRPQVSM